MSPEQNAGKISAYREAIKALERWNSQIFEKTLSNDNCIREEIQSKLNSGNAYYYWVQNTSSSLLFKNKKTKIHGTKILHNILYECSTCPPTLREESRLSVFENHVLHDLHPLTKITSLINPRSMKGGSCSTYGRGEVQTWFYWRNHRKIQDLELLGLEGRTILKRMFNKRWGWTGLLCLRIGTGGGLM
jgi:hypothetical protein